MSQELKPRNDIKDRTPFEAQALQSPMVSDKAALLPAAAAQPQAAGEFIGPPAPKRFGKMTESEKARNLAQLMDNSAGTLKENGVSEQMEDMLAGVMMNEGGSNTRRVKLAGYFNEVMMGNPKLGTKGLMGQIDKVGLEKLQSDPKALETFRSKLGEDQTHLLEQVMSGGINYEGLKSKDPKEKDAAKQQLLDTGIDLRTQQYEEYSGLSDRQRSGEKLDDKEAARLKKLGNLGGAAMGYDSLDRRKGVDATMADTRGLSSDRFREIYGDTQTRFEPVHYRRWRDQYEAQTAANAKLPEDKQKPVHMETAIGDYTATADDKTKLSQNYDLLADLNTSYGAPQVMGLYGHSGQLKAKDAEGTDIDFNLETLKQSGRRHHVTEADLQLQIGMLGMKGINLGSKTMTAETMTDNYNGNRKVNKHWSTYVSRLKNNVGVYQGAEKTLDAEKAAKAKASAPYAD